MRRVIVSEFMALDGVIEDPSWTQPYWNDEIADFKFNELFSADGLLLGRTTYEGFAAAWPGQKDEKGYADRMNNMPKYVVSTTMDQGSWTNTTVLRENPAEKIAALKQEQGQDLLVFGSGTLIQFLLENKLVDAYHLLVYPVAVGKGKRLFWDGVNTKMKLVENKRTSSGVVALVYEADNS